MYVMFVPRQIQKKATQSRSSIPTSSTSSKKTPGQLPPPINSPKNPEPKTSTELCASNGIDPVVAKETVMALEMLLSDFSINYVYGEWLRERMRKVEEKDDFIHLSAFMDCSFLAKLKPSQVNLIKAFGVCGSDLLELSTDKHHLRRKQAFASSKKQNPDEFTIYIEPHITNMTSDPGKVARMISEQLPPQYLPVQFVESKGKAWAFVMLSSEISQTDAEDKELWPKDWVVLTKPEWRRRDTEYKRLRLAVISAANYHYQTQTQGSARQGGGAHSRPEMAGSGARVVPLKAIETRHENSSRSREASGPAFESGLIVRLANLDPTTTKDTIHSFICRSVDRYLRRKVKSQKKMKEGKSEMTDAQPIKINYVDYGRGLCEAYLRQSSCQDSKLIVDALGKRRRNMKNGHDIKGGKAVKGDERNWVSGIVLEGEEERIYWEKVFSAKNNKGKGMGKRGRNDERLATPSFISSIEGTRKGDEENVYQVSKRIKFSE